MGRRSKGKKRVSVEKNLESSETLENSVEEVTESIKTVFTHLEEENTSAEADGDPETASPARTRSRLPVPCDLGLGDRHSSVKAKVVFQKPNVQESPDCKRSLIPRLLPVRSAQNHSSGQKADKYDVKRIAQEA